MNIETPFIVVSSDRSEYSEPVNVERRDLFERQLEHRGLSFKRVSGVYAGTSEASYVVLTPDTASEAAVFQLARRYGQESVLLVDANRFATLAYLHNGSGGPDVRELKGVGFWRPASQDEAEAGDAYTLDVVNGQHVYYVTKPNP